MNINEYIIEKIGQEKNGKVVEFELRIPAKNIVEDEEHKFFTVDEILSKTSKNPVQNKVVTEALNVLTEIIGGKADILTVNRTVYVSENGNDNTGNGTQEKPWRTIQYAIDNVPVINGNQEYIISISAGTYGGFIAKSVSATIQLAGNITVTDTKTYPIEIDDSNIKFNGDGNTINITSQSYGSLFYIHNGGRINSYRTTFKLSGNGEGNGIQIVSDGGFSQTNANMSFERLGTAVYVSTNSVFYSEGMYGGELKRGIMVSAGGRVAYGTNTMTATTSVVTESGGRIYSGSQEL